MAKKLKKPAVTISKYDHEFYEDCFMSMRDSLSHLLDDDVFKGPGAAALNKALHAERAVCSASVERMMALIDGVKKQ